MTRCHNRGTQNDWRYGRVVWAAHRQMGTQSTFATFVILGRWHWSVLSYQKQHIAANFQQMEMKHLKEGCLFLNLCQGANWLVEAAMKALPSFNRQWSQASPWADHRGLLPLSQCGNTSMVSIPWALVDLLKIVLKVQFSSVQPATCPTLCGPAWILHDASPYSLTLLWVYSTPRLSNYGSMYLHYSAVPFLLSLPGPQSLFLMSQSLRDEVPRLSSGL